MRRSLANSINLQHIPIRPTDFTGARVTSTRYYTKIHTNFNLMLIPVIGDGNCLFRTLSHIIFGVESEHHNVRDSLIQTFEPSSYVGALCGLQGYNTSSGATGPVGPVFTGPLLRKAEVVRFGPVVAFFSRLH